MKHCGPRKPVSRHRINIAVPEELWDRFSKVLETRWGDSLTSWIEFAMECYTRENCEGCPYDEGGETTSKGIGKKLQKQ